MQVLSYLLLLVTVALSIFNATLYSPLYDSVAYFLYLFTRRSANLSPDVLAYATSVFLGLMTLLLAGIPAAAYERMRGLKQSTLVSLAIWMIAAALLALPAATRLLGDE
jgi:hypothetical protein